jgi:rfaE bifunctional protein kinase chain/domain
LHRTNVKTADLDPARLRELIDLFPTQHIAVLGDFFLDKYLDVDPALAEKSLETDKVAHQVVRVRSSPGAAGTVTSNLAALGAGKLYAIGFRGDDGEGYELRKGLADLGCSTEHLHVAADLHTPTYLKPRNFNDPTLAGEHSRYDTKNRSSTPKALQKTIVESLETLLPHLHAVIVADQVEEADCGVVTLRVREVLAAQARRNLQVIFWADSRRRIHEFRGVTVKPNQFEAVGRESRAPDDAVSLDELQSAVQRMRSRNGAPVVVTRGKEGMIVSDPEWTLVPGVKIEGETDPTGAGDSATAGTVLALSAGASLPEAAVLGNLVASITIQQLGTTGVAKPADLPSRLEMWRKQQGK